MNANTASRPLLRCAARSWLVIAVLLSAATAAADEIGVLCSNGIRTVLEELVPEFERSTNQRVAVTYGVSASLARQIEAGEPFDVAILTRSLIDTAVAQAKVRPGSTAVLARSAMSLGFRPGPRKPDLTTIENLKRTLSRAASIAYAREGASAPFFTDALRRLGLAAEIAPKIRLTENGAQAGRMVAAGDADLCVLPASEILPIAGLEVAGPFPGEFSGYLTIAAGVGASARQPAAAAAFIRFLGSPAAAPVLARKGMDRP